MTDRPLVVLRGKFGWGNRKFGLEAYGPGGRWEGRGTNADYGNLLGDALERAGATEGATLLIVAVPRFGDLSVLDECEAAVRDADTLTQARQLAAQAQACGHPSSWAETVQVLLDLLAGDRP